MPVTDDLNRDELNRLVLSLANRVADQSELLSRKADVRRMASADAWYATLITSILERGTEVHTRNSVCRRVFSYPTRFTKTPLVSARRAAWKNALREWQWFMSGSNNIEDLHPAVRAWWQPWANPTGHVKNNYSEQFRHACGGFCDPQFADIQLIVHDQLAALVDGVKRHPFSRRNIMTTWNAAEMSHPSTPITNCHGTVVQAFVEPDRSLHLVTYQRSADVVCGLPHNWVQYWAFLLWLAHRTGTRLGSLEWIGGDIHVYKAHEVLAEQIVAAARYCKPTPELVYTPTSEEFLADDFTLDGEYTPVLEDRAEMIV